MAIHRQLTLCRRIRALRDGAGFTQNEVAEKLGISQAAYCRLERGEIEVSVRRLVELGAIYGVPVAKLMEGL